MSSREAAAELGRALRYATHIESIRLLGTLGLLVSVIEWAGTLPWSVPTVVFPLARAVPAVYFFFVMHQSAVGSLRLPRPADFRDTWDALLFPLFQLVVAGTWYWAAIAASAARDIGVRAFVTRQQCRVVELMRRPGPIPYVALGVALIYLPAALVAAVLSDRLLPLLDPSWGVRLVARAGRPYRRVFALICLLTVGLYLADLAGVLLQQAVPVPLATPVVRQMLVLWVPLVQARLLGGFIERHKVQLVLGTS